MSDGKNVTADRLVEAYLKVRTRREKLKAEYDTADAELEEKITAISDALANICKEIGADSIRTSHGLVLRSVRTRYWASDWSAMYDFIKEHGAVELLEKRIAQKNMEQFLIENPETHPIGLNKERKYVVSVRKG